MLNKNNESIFISVRSAIRCVLRQELIEKSFMKVGLLIEPNDDNGSISSMMYKLQDDITKTIFELMGLSINNENITRQYYEKVSSIENYEDIDNITEDIFSVLKENSSLYDTPGKGRMTEIATKVIDGLLADDEEAALIYLYDEVELNKEECAFFGINYKDMVSTE